MGIEDDRWIGNLKHPAMRAAARRWSDRQRTAGRSDGVRARLSKDWKHLVRVYGLRASPGLFFAVFEALARRAPPDLPSSTRVRHAMRLARAFPTREGWAILGPLLRNEDGSRPGTWLEAVAPLRIHREARLAATANFEALRNLYAVLAGAYFPELEEVLLEARVSPRPERLSGSTDGRRIWLPAKIALDADPRLNALAGTRVLFHELGHISEGSFTLAGSELHTGVLARSIEAARAKGRALKMTRARLGAPPLERIFRQFPRPNLLHGLWNLVEDARVEARLERRLPFFANLRAAVSALEARHHSLVAFESAHGLFLRALARRVNGETPRPLMAERYRALDAAVARRLEATPARRLKDTAAALALAIDLYVLLADDAEARRDPSVLELVETHADENDLVASRTRHAPWEEIEAPRTVDPSGYYPIEFVRGPETDHDLPGPSFVYPEWNEQEGRLEPQAVRVHDRTERPEVERFWQRDPVTSLAAGTVRARTRRRREEGLLLDTARAYDWAVARRSGREADRRVFVATRRVPLFRPRTIHVVIDVSSSMGRDASNTMSPIELARDLVRGSRSIAAKLCTLAVYGAVDSGRRSIRFSRDLELKATGGFRFGALVRHVASRLAVPGDRLVLMTDTASHYVAMGVDAHLLDFVSRSCDWCRHRSDCPRDPRQPWIEGRDHKRTHYLPTVYEMADLRHAIASSGLPVGLVLFGRAFQGTTLDRAVGAGSWWRVAAPGDLEEVRANVERWCVSPRSL